MRILFSMLALTLAAVLAWQWRGWPPAPPQVSAADQKASSDATAEHREESPLELLTPLGDKDEYAQVTERPLFLPDRRPPSEEPPEEKPAEPEQIGDLARMDLNAVMITPGESSAWVRDPSNKELLRLRPGDELVGWSVKEILSDRLLLERQGDTDTLILRDYKNMPPPVKPRQKPAVRRRPQRAPQETAKAPPRTPNAKRPNVPPKGVSRPDPRQQDGDRQYSPRSQGRENGG